MSDSCFWELGRLSEWALWLPGATAWNEDRADWHPLVPTDPFFPKKSINDQPLIKVVIAVQLFYHGVIQSAFSTSDHRQHQCSENPAGLTTIARVLILMTSRRKQRWMRKLSRFNAIPFRPGQPDE